MPRVPDDVEIYLEIEKDRVALALGGSVQDKGVDKAVEYADSIGASRDADWHATVLLLLLHEGIVDYAHLPLGAHGAELTSRGRTYRSLVGAGLSATEWLDRTGSAVDGLPDNLFMAWGVAKLMLHQYAIPELKQLIESW